MSATCASLQALKCASHCSMKYGTVYSVPCSIRVYRQCDQIGPFCAVWATFCSFRRLPFGAKPGQWNAGFNGHLFLGRFLHVLGNFWVFRPDNLVALALGGRIMLWNWSSIFRMPPGSKITFNAASEIKKISPQTFCRRRSGSTQVWRHRLGASSLGNGNYSKHEAP